MLLTIGVRLISRLVVEEVDRYTQVVRWVQSGQIHIALGHGGVTRLGCLDLHKLSAILDIGTVRSQRQQYLLTQLAGRWKSNLQCSCFETQQGAREQRVAHGHFERQTRCTRRDTKESHNDIYISSVTP